jgi:cation-transporting ATPase E
MPHIVDEGRRVINNIQRATALFLVKNIFTLLLVLASLVTSLAYPFEPVNLTLVTALTVGVPSFFFAMEPNYERVRGTFLLGALRRALPAGIAAFGAVVATQLLAPHLGVEGVGLNTACSAALAAIGVLVLVWVSRPMTALRGVVLGSMSVLLVGAFLLPVELFKLSLYEGQTALLSVAVSVLAVVLALVLRLITEGVLHLRRKG